MHTYCHTSCHTNQQGKALYSWHQSTHGHRCTSHSQGGRSMGACTCRTGSSLCQRTLPYKPLSIKVPACLGDTDRYQWWDHKQLLLDNCTLICKMLHKILANTWHCNGYHSILGDSNTLHWYCYTNPYSCSHTSIGTLIRMFLHDTDCCRCCHGNLPHMCSFR